MPRCANLGAAILLACAIFAAAQNPAPSLRFDAASVKPAPAPTPPYQIHTNVEHERLTFTNVTLANCIRQAYGLRPYQVIGGPDWMRADYFNITAVAAGDPSRADMMTMLKALLADRFQLAVHQEPRPMPVYALVVAPKGLKIHLAKPDEPSVIGAESTPPYSGTAISMAQLAAILAQPAGRPVVDLTGLTGRYDVPLTWTPPANDSDSGPSIFTAVEEELGLRLEPRTLPVPVLVIDHAAKPTPN